MKNAKRYLNIQIVYGGIVHEYVHYNCMKFVKVKLENTRYQNAEKINFNNYEHVTFFLEHGLGLQRKQWQQTRLTTLVLYKFFKKTYL